MTTVPTDTPVNELITNVITAVGAKAPEPPKNNDKYRYYHCYSGWTGLKCKKVDGPDVMPSEDYTKLLFVKSYIPERFDKYILKYKWIPDGVIIENQFKSFKR